MWYKVNKLTSYSEEKVTSNIIIYVFLAKMDVKHIKIEYYLPFEVITQPYFFDHRQTVARDMSVTF